MEVFLYILTLTLENLYGASLGELVFGYEGDSLSKSVKTCYTDSVASLKKRLKSKNKELDKSSFKDFSKNEDNLRLIIDYLFNENVEFNNFTCEIDNIEKEDLNYFIDTLKTNFVNDPLISQLYALKISTDKIIDEIHKSNSSNLQRIDDLRLLPLIPYSSDKILQRTDYFDKIDKAFEKSRISYLHGDGGIGKSEIAKSYINQKVRAKKFDCICWITYEDNLYKSIVNQLNILGYYRDKNKNEIDVFNEYLLILRNMVQNGNEILIVLDNFDVENDKHLISLINTGIKLIITSRNRTELFNIIEVLSMDESDLFKIFRTYCTSSKYYSNTSSISLIYQIINLLQKHTLAVELIAKTIENGKLNLDDVVEKLKRGIDKLTYTEHINMLKDENLYQGKMYELILSIYSLSDLDDVEKAILINMSVFPLSGIKETYILDILGLKNNDKINSLILKGWLKYDSNLELIYVHTIIRDISFCEFQVSPSSIDNTITYLENLLDSTDEEFFQLQEYIDISLCVIVRIEKIDFIILNLKIKTAIALIYLGKYSQSREMFFEVIDDIDDVINISYIQQQELLYKCYLYIGFSYSKEYNKEDAIKNYELSQSFLDELKKYKSVSYRQLYNNIGMVYYRAKDNDNALKYYNKALNEVDQDTRADFLELAEVYNNLGALYDNIYLEGKNKNILKNIKLYYVKSLRIRKKYLGRKNMLTLVTYNNLGTVLFREKKFNLSLLCLNGVYKYRKNLYLNQNHHEIAEVLYNIGYILFSIGKQEDADIKFNEAINILSIDIENQKSLIKEMLKTIIEMFSNNKAICNKYESILESIDK